jgi:hypothetical protein
MQFYMFAGRIDWSVPVPGRRSMGWFLSDLQLFARAEERFRWFCTCISSAIAFSTTWIRILCHAASNHSDGGGQSGRSPLLCDCMCLKGYAKCAHLSKNIIHFGRSENMGQPFFTVQESAVYYEENTLLWVPLSMAHESAGKTMVFAMSAWSEVLSWME